ncbi:hypothetical protein HGA91_05660 [candidate division WWE3 bacterium]|nr:hypothetical protein [candidate division WWE3 bacterium]
MSQYLLGLGFHAIMASIVALIHTYGHLYAARKSGIEVIGWCVGPIGNNHPNKESATIGYGLLPFSSRIQADDFHNAPMWAKVLTLLGGAIANLVCALVIAGILATTAWITHNQSLVFQVMSRIPLLQPTLVPPLIGWMKTVVLTGELGSTPDIWVFVIHCVVMVIWYSSAAAVVSLMPIAPFDLGRILTLHRGGNNTAFDNNFHLFAVVALGFLFVLIGLGTL